jgi:putative endopeptidase
MRGTPLLVAGLVACSGGSSTRSTTPPPPAPADAAVVEPPPAMSLAEAGLMEAWLDPEADPCEDFFQYACGGFIAGSEIPPDRASWSAIQLVVQRNEELLRDIVETAPAGTAIGDYYAACMDEDAIARAGTRPLGPYLDVIAKVKDRRSAARAVIALHADGVAPFFGIAAYQDFADATQVIAHVDQDGLGLPDRDYYLSNRGNLEEVRATYRDHVGRMFRLLGTRKVDAAVADVLRIETALARLHQDKITRRDPRAVYHRIDRAGLDKLAPAFPWKDYLVGLGIPDVTAISVHDPAYYPAVVKLIHKEKPAALRHYLTWTVLTTLAEHLDDRFVAEDFTLTQALRGVKELPPRWRRCVDRVDADLGELLAQPYVDARFGPGSKQVAIELIHEVMAAMDTQLGVLPWMDASTRDAARTKLAKMGYLVGYPERWRSYDFAVSRSDHAGNVLAARRFDQARRLAKIGQPVDRDDWEMTPPTVNAYYDPTLNLMALPAGQLQPPFFGATFHPAVNFAATGGGTIGHELTHGFDDEGSQFDADGNLRDWWSAATKAEFVEATACVVDQYGRYEAVPGVHLDGKLTAGENIADVGGVKLGYLAYRAWRDRQATPPPPLIDGLSDDQLYFLAYAQSWCSKDTPERLETMAHSNPHSPPRWRVNGVIVNQAGFAPAFRCATGAAMNPGNACAVW